MLCNCRGPDTHSTLEILASPSVKSLFATNHMEHHDHLRMLSLLKFIEYVRMYSWVQEIEYFMGIQEYLGKTARRSIRR